MVDDIIENFIIPQLKNKAIPDVDQIEKQAENSLALFSYRQMKRLLSDY